MRRFIVAVALVSLVVSACGGGGERVVLAAGTTIVDSGLLDLVVSKYEAAEPGVQISVVGESTAAVLELGRRGGAEVLIVHAPAQEAAFVDEGRAAVYEPVFTSRFVLVGPADAAATVGGSVVDAFASIARNELPFVSRADGSGTHERELELWELAGVEPSGQGWYTETGQGMGLTLQVADQLEAFALTELGAFLAAAGTLSLEEVPLAGEARLSNPYHVIVVADAGEAALTFAEYLTAPAGQRDIEQANQELFGALIYAPASP